MMMSSRWQSGKRATDPKEIEAAYNELKKLMPNVAAFNSDNPANPYMEGEVNLGMIWNGSAFVARQAGKIGN